MPLDDAGRAFIVVGLIVILMIFMMACTEILIVYPEQCLVIQQDTVLGTQVMDTIPADSVQYHPECLQSLQDSADAIHRRR